MADEPAEQPPRPAADGGKVQELEDRLAELTQRLEGMDKDSGDAKGVADRFHGMEERMKSLLQLSEILSVRYNPFLDSEEKDLFEPADPNKFLPRPHEKPASPPETAPPAQEEALADEEPVPKGPSARPGGLRPEVVPIESDDVVPEAEEVSTVHTPPPLPAEGEAVPEDRPHAAPGEPKEAARSPFEVPGFRDDQSPSDALDAILEEAETYLPDPEEVGALPEFGPEPIEDLPLASQESTPQDLEQAPEPGPPAGSPDEDTTSRSAAATAQRPADKAPTLRPGPGRMPRPEERAIQAPPPAAAPGPAATPPSLWQPSHSGGRSKQTYWTLSWFEQLASQGDPSEIHLFLDHYTRLGWIPGDAYGWMRSLADSIAPRRDDLAWEDLQLHSVDLARLHKENLRFLQRLFDGGLDDPDPRSWSRQDADWPGGD